MLKHLYLSVTLLLTFSISVWAQQNPYFYQIPDTPKLYSAANVAARMVDGLGFRYYWATSGLTEEDLAFKPGDSSRTTYETLEHIFSLTEVLVNAVNKTSTKSGAADRKLSLLQLRTQTLKNLETASKYLKRPGVKLQDLDMVFESAKGNTRYPFWNLINGPIADALWHVGQVVSFRRSSGNPFPKGVSVLQGKKFN